MCVICCTNGVDFCPNPGSRWRLAACLQRVPRESSDDACSLYRLFCPALPGLAYPVSSITTFSCEAPHRQVDRDKWLGLPAPVVLACIRCFHTSHPCTAWRRCPFKVGLPAWLIAAVPRPAVLLHASSYGLALMCVWVALSLFWGCVAVGFPWVLVAVTWPVCLTKQVAAVNAPVQQQLRHPLTWHIRIACARCVLSVGGC